MNGSQQQTLLFFLEVVALAIGVLRSAGVPADSAELLGNIVACAERDGTHSHGLARLPDYVASIRSGWLRPDAQPTIQDASPGLLLVDAANGFTQVAARAAQGQLLEKVRYAGIAALCLRNGHHIGPLWTDVEPLAELGFLALTCVNSRARLVPAGGREKLFGSNAMAFASPGSDGLPLVWDQSSSVMSLGDIKLAAAKEENLSEGVGADANGNPTTDPRAILAGGSLRPFGGHKGSAIALMVEVLAAGLSGGNFGFEDESAAYPSAASSNAGQFLVVIDPVRTAGAGFTAHVDKICQRLRGDADARVPGDRRRRRRAENLRQGIPVSEATLEALQRLIRGQGQRQQFA